MQSVVLFELVKKWEKQAEPTVEGSPDLGDETETGKALAWSQGNRRAKLDCAQDVKTLIELLGGDKC